VRYGRIELSKQALNFSIAHFTIFSSTEREDLHGHNFQLECDVTAPIGDDGMMFDYGKLKKLLRALCDDIDEQMILPENSPHLSIEGDGDYIVAIFNKERIPFLRRDVRLLPIASRRQGHNGNYGQGLLQPRPVRCRKLEQFMKTLVITGASKGIGFATATHFADNGYRVINISRSPADDDRIENHSVDLKLSDSEFQLEELLNMIVDGGEICLVHNAALNEGDTAQDTDTNSFLEALQVNVVAPNYLNRILLPMMTAGSSIVYVGSTLSEKAVPGSFSYVVSKHAMIGMMRATCQDLAGRSIQTACVCPGFTDTEMLRGHIGDNQEILDSVSAMSTFGRLITPEEIADAIWFCAGSPVINGAVIHANLGQIER
jgi:NAD(P)-dependent dehydrogenase (short-subunit alcohol dehydrogenase family)